MCTLSEAGGVAWGRVMLYLAQECMQGQEGGISCKDEEQKLLFLVSR